MPKVLIVGAGLSGLTTAFALKESKYEVEILEARSRLGGRIFTIDKSGTHLELGATWFGPQHTSLLSLIEKLNVPYKIQENGREALYDFRPKGYLERFQIPDQGPPTYKFKAGTSALIKKLYETINLDVHYNEVVKKVKWDTTFQVETLQNHFEADYLIMSIPPQLVADTIHFTPNLPHSSLSLFQNTHTWMSDSIKFSIAFENDFWKTGQFTGTMMSPQQVIQEMYDHSDVDQPQNALVGFLNSAYSMYSKEERQAHVLNQFKSIFSADVNKCLDYEDVDWKREEFTIQKEAKLLSAHQNNGNSGLRKGFYDNRLFFSASETSAQTPGYMDGAVHRGNEVAQFLLNLLA